MGAQKVTMTTCEQQPPGNVTLQTLVKSITDTCQEKHPRGVVAGEKKELKLLQVKVL